MATRTEKRRLAGLCTQCGQVRSSGQHACCSGCLQVAAKRRETRKAELRDKVQATYATPPTSRPERAAAGLCRECGGEKHDGRRLNCDACRAKTAARDLARVTARTSKGCCSSCGAQVQSGPLSRGALCSDCSSANLVNAARYRGKHRDKVREAQSKGREARLASGKCGLCPHPRMEGVSVCERHWFGQAANGNLGLGTDAGYEFLSALFAAQGALCPYTGRVLIPGVNAALDHIMPVSRFPELANDPANVQWVSVEINRAKGSLTDVEFVALCASVVANYDRDAAVADRSTVALPPRRDVTLPRLKGKRAKKAAQ